MLVRSGQNADANFATATVPTPAPGNAGDEIFIVDDDPLITDLLSAVFRTDGFRVMAFNDGESFRAVARVRNPVCIILDVCMPGKSGLDLLKDLDAQHYGAPIVIMSGHASIPMAVEALKNGAFDIIEKPFSLDTIVARIRTVTEAWERNRANDGRSEALKMQFPGSDRLTQREVEVLAEIMAAASNKEAGLHLGISARTVEVHRAGIMIKLRAKNTADLVRIVLNKRAD